MQNIIIRIIIVERFLCPELFVQLRHVIIPLGLVQVPSDGIPQLILLRKLTNGELPTIIPRTVRQLRFVGRYLPWLFINDEHVPVQPGAFRGSGTDVLAHYLAFVHTISRDIHDEPMMPFTELRFFPTIFIFFNQNVDRFKGFSRRTCSGRPDPSCRGCRGLHLQRPR